MAGLTRQSVESLTSAKIVERWQSVDDFAKLEFYKAQDACPGVSVVDLTWYICAQYFPVAPCDTMTKTTCELATLGNVTSTYSNSTVYDSSPYAGNGTVLGYPVCQSICKPLIGRCNAVKWDGAPQSCIDDTSLSSCTTGEQSNIFYIIGAGAAGLFGVMSMITIFYAWYKFTKTDMKLGATTRWSFGLLAVYFLTILFEVVRQTLFFPNTEVKCDLSFCIFYFLESLLFFLSVIIAFQVYFVCCYPMHRYAGNVYHMPIHIGPIVIPLKPIVIAIAVLYSISVAGMTKAMGGIHPTADKKGCELSNLEIKIYGPYMFYFVLMAANVALFTVFGREIAKIKKKNTTMKDKTEKSNAPSKRGSDARVQTTAFGRIKKNLKDLTKVLKENAFVVRFLSLLGFMVLPQVVIVVLRPSRIDSIKYADPLFAVSTILTTSQPIFLCWALFPTINEKIKSSKSSTEEQSNGAQGSEQSRLNSSKLSTANRGSLTGSTATGKSVGGGRGSNANKVAPSPLIDKSPKINNGYIGPS